MFYRTHAQKQVKMHKIKKKACNTQGVCHQLSSGFELKHDKLSGDEDVNVKPMEMIYAWVVLLHPCLHIGPFQDICFGGLIRIFSCVSQQ
jgi:hypothetical protein